jgi:hypothetical protein
VGQLQQGGGDEGGTADWARVGNTGEIGARRSRDLRTEVFFLGFCAQGKAGFVVDLLFHEFWLFFRFYRVINLFVFFYIVFYFNLQDLLQGFYQVIT